MWALTDRERSDSRGAATPRDRAKRVPGDPGFGATAPRGQSPTEDASDMPERRPSDTQRRHVPMLRSGDPVG